MHAERASFVLAHVGLWFHRMKLMAAESSVQNKGTPIMVMIALIRAGIGFGMAKGEKLSSVYFISVTERVSTASFI